MYQPKGPKGSKRTKPPAPPVGGTGVSGPLGSGSGVGTTLGVRRAFASIEKKLNDKADAQIARCSYERGMLHGLMLKHGLRNDWHEPDEQGIRARIIGDHLDNAFGAHEHESHHLTEPGVQEFVVILEKESEYKLLADGEHGTTWKEIARFNLCDLLANLATIIPTQCASCNGFVDVGDGRS